MAVFGLAACSTDGAVSTTTTADGPGAPAASPTSETTSTTVESSTTSPVGPAVGPIAWERVSLGFVSAYVLVRDDTAAIVDTGVGGSEDEIEAALGAAGSGWDEVGHVILTHLHGDHVGSLEQVLDRAPTALVYAGEADIPRIGSSRPITPVTDGDDVFGLEIVATPGHTEGHISVLDPAGGVLVVGDALNGGDTTGGAPGTVAGPNPQFSSDMATANETVRKLAGLRFETLLFGHGEPIESGAAQQVAALAAAL